MPRMLLEAVFVLAVVGCHSSGGGLAKMYCEGGVDDDRPLGGECFAIEDRKLDDDPTTIGSGRLVSDPTRPMSIRRVDANHWNLFREGSAVGTLALDGHWLTAAIDGRTVHVRSDPPGFFQ